MRAVTDARQEVGGGGVRLSLACPLTGHPGPVVGRRPARLERRALEILLLRVAGASALRAQARVWLRCGPL